MKLFIKSLSVFILLISALFVLLPTTAQAATDPCAKFDGIINQAVAKYGVRKSLLVTQLKMESGCNPKAVSKTGDYGICQINLKANKVTAAQAFDPNFCVDFQGKRMGYLVKKYGEYNALRGYNCGEGGMKNKNCGVLYANLILKLAK